MPQLTIEGRPPVAVPDGKRLINAITDEGGVADQLHACGGNARCTTCRVQFLAGEPDEITQAEKELLAARGLTAHAGVRLACQVRCNQDMTVRPISLLPGSGRKDTGGRPADDIQPPPAWTTK